jgi:hypothetical protein
LVRTFVILAVLLLALALAGALVETLRGRRPTLLS